MNPSVRYDCAQTELVVGRVAGLPVTVATEILAAEDPIEATREFLKSHSFARTAIGVASPSLSEALDAWLSGERPRNEKMPLRALSYVLRMASRTTPFGLFAGVGRVEVGDDGPLEIDETAGGMQTQTRPDMELMTAIARAAEREECRERVTYVTNDCAFVRGGRLHVVNVELANVRTAGRLAVVEQRDVSLKHTKAVAFVRERCAGGLPYADLVAALVAEFGATPDESARLTDRLIESGVIISELRPSPIDHPIDGVLERLDAIGDARAVKLRQALAAAQRLDAIAVKEQQRSDYDEVRHAFVEIAGEVSPNAIQVDLRSGFCGALPASVLSDAAVLADCAVRSGRVFRLERYRQRFIERYEGSDRMVPLLELVDNNVGLGNPRESTFDAGNDDARQELLTYALSQAARDNAEELDLDGALLDAVLPSREAGRLPASLEVGFQLAAGSFEDVLRGNYRMVCTLLSDRCGRMIGRFAEMLGDDTVDRLREIAHRSREEELTAELTYIPVSSRAYNVCIRPRLYEYEVRAGIGSPKQNGTISPEDLWVGIDGDRFYLWSKMHGRRVSVCETHAFMTSHAAPNLCRFLALLQRDGQRVAEFDLGGCETMPYVPRLRRGRVVLRPRRWKFPQALFAGNAAAIARTLDDLRSRWQLPRYVFLAAGDNRLPLDLDSAVTPALMELHTGDRAVELLEALPAPDQHWVRGSDGVRAAEFVVQAISRDNASRRPALAAPVLIADRVRHGPGSQWVYVKMYMGEQAADDFIVSSVLPLVRELQGPGSIDRWFFLRYQDLAHHIRLRFHARDVHAAAGVRETVLQHAEAWLQASRLERYCVDTYDPEFERYGGPAQLEQAEEFFSRDSEACADILAEGAGDSGERIESAAASFDAWIRAYPAADALLLDVYGRMEKKTLEARDRESLRRIGAAGDGGSGANPLQELLEGRNGAARLLGAFVHMHCNRLGIDTTLEARVCALLRSLALARTARRPKRVLEATCS